MKILVADDDIKFANAVARFLRKQGAEVVQVGSGNEAFAAIRAQTFDFLITDLRMPSGTGIELLRRIRRFRDQLGCVPRIIVNTGYIDQGETYLKALGAEVVLQKPYSLAQLLTAIKSVKILATIE